MKQANDLHVLEKIVLGTGRCFPWHHRCVTPFYFLFFLEQFGFAMVLVKNKLIRRRISSGVYNY